MIKLHDNLRKSVDLSTVKKDEDGLDNIDSFWEAYEDGKDNGVYLS
jgi:hypothetical protein